MNRIIDIDDAISGPVNDLDSAFQDRFCWTKMWTGAYVCMWTITERWLNESVPVRDISLTTGGGVDMLGKIHLRYSAIRAPYGIGMEIRDLPYLKGPWFRDPPPITAGRH